MIRNSLVAAAMLVFTVLFVSPVSAQNISCTDLKKTWVNQLKSEMVIDTCDDHKGSFEGTYKSPSGTQAQKFRMRGVFNQKSSSSGDQVTVISFTVRWNDPIDGPSANFGSITAWNGVLRNQNGVPTIIAQ